IVEHGDATVRSVGGKQAHNHVKDIFERERGRQRLLKEIDLADGAGVNRDSQNTRNHSGHLRFPEQMISSADDESRIAALIAAVDVVMDRCEQTARTTSRSLLCWLRSVRPHVCYIKPFIQTSSLRPGYAEWQTIIRLTIPPLRLNQELRYK
ncbi:hypothetical protein FOC1_g10001869, partial [Fusarium oxysporum f. sp. cubense race 1]